MFLLQNVNYMKDIKLFSFFLFATFFAYSQNDATFWNDAMKGIARYQGQEGWIELSEENTFSHTNFFLLNRDAFQMNRDDEMVLKKEDTDFTGQTRYLYQQYYKGIEVEGALYLLHQEDGRVYLANGKFIRNINLNIQPRISREDAFRAAKASMNAFTYSWEVPDTSFYYLSQDTGKLLIFNPSVSESRIATTPLLAYKFKISAVEPDMGYSVYVDANTGEILSSLTLNYQANCHSGTAITLYNGQKTITTRKGLLNYQLRDDCRGGGIHTGIQDNLVKDDDNYWSDPDKQPAVSAHWASEKTYDYFYNTFNRNSYDGNGIVITNCTMMPEPLGQSNPVAWYRPSYKRFEFFNPDNVKFNNHPVSLDAVGHEYTHGIIYHSSNLTYEGESGALSESFADIFGNMVKYSVTGNVNNYLMGEDFWIADGKKSDFSNPNSKSHPQTYKGQYWLTQTTPDTTMHTNCGVQNHWFYLLANGGSGVQGIGRNKAAEIAYLNMTTFLLPLPQATYSDAAMGAIKAAQYLFGTCSNEMIQTYKAWQAVGVPVNIASISEYNLTPSCNFINNPPFPQNLLPTRTFIAINNITSNCSITTTKPVIFKAGNEIILSPGFSSRNDFHALIVPCLTSNTRSMVLATEISEDDETNNFYYDIMPPKKLLQEENEKKNQELNNEITLYPNPNTGSFTITGEDIQEIEVFNLLGQSIYSVKNPQTYTINLPNAAKGTFFVRITTSKESVTKKVVVQ